MTPPPPSLLLVDDDPSGRYMKGRVLRQAGFEVLEASTGNEALRAVVAAKPALVILDTHLPDLDGWEICRRIKADPVTAAVLVLQMSATYVAAEDTTRALDGGADACLTEPVEPAVIVAIVKALLRIRRAEEALRESLGREQAARRECEEANRAKDDFLATLSHELRSPLAGILTWVTLLRRGQLDESKRDRALEAIERGTRLQVKLIEDVLDVSRVIAGKLRLEVRLLDLGGVIEAALEVVRPVADGKGVMLEVSLDPAVGPVLGDPDRLQQAVGNLLSNAVKFTPRGGRVGVALSSVVSQACIRVTDTGQGISPHFLPHIFERFRQADASTTRAQGGLGLGLAIVRHLVELHGGSARADSAGLGKGATFTVLLPLPAIRPQPDSIAGEKVHRPLPDLAGIRVLVVEDEADARDAITAVLEQCGAQVTAAGSVAEALADLDAQLPDVLVSDVAMPGEGGYDLIRVVRDRTEDRGGAIPAIALTAYASSDDERGLLAAGFQAYLAKPVEPQRLAVTIGRVTTGRST